VGKWRAVAVSHFVLNPEWEHAQFVSIAELRECERKLKAANDRIKELEAKIAELHDLEKWLEGR
jgi:hypothetical protein